ncbi:MAG TPA: RNA-guided pseudouridylation complex pseudouridine synthase subunit Cbf5 [Nanoarchaeota archaeon]|nr:RNA-guided pseudouridylation complex pseudouridine synthase subunit Cbf5 [Nanoarchaeota archaeon]
MKREFLIREYEASLTDFGKYPGARSIEELLRFGLAVIDKPPGPTCQQIDAWIKKLLELKKCSHGGTLDPRVSGVLVIALNDAVKLMPLLLKSDKEYIALMHLHKEVDEEKLQNVIKKFIGEIEQVPPKKSAVARKARKRKVYEIKIIEKEGRDVILRISCEAGTYIRKLIADMGKYLGGAHMQELRRIRSGIFTEDHAVLLQDLVDAYKWWKETGEEKYLREIIYPGEKICDFTKVIVIKDTAVEAICSGAPLSSAGIIMVEKGIKENDIVCILTLKGELVALAKALISSEEMLRGKKLAAKIERVIMPRGTYPRFWKTKSKS